MTKVIKTKPPIQRSGHNLQHLHRNSLGSSWRKECHIWSSWGRNDMFGHLGEGMTCLVILGKEWHVWSSWGRNDMFGHLAMVLLTLAMVLLTLAMVLTTFAMVLITWQCFSGHQPRYPFARQQFFSHWPCYYSLPFPCWSLLWLSFSLRFFYQITPHSWLCFCSPWPCFPHLDHVPQHSTMFLKTSAMLLLPFTMFLLSSDICFSSL